MNLEDWLVKHRKPKRLSLHNEACTAIGDNDTDTELTLESQAGEILDLKINNGVVSINGNVTIIRADLFSEQGVMHIIDRPLQLVPWWKGVTLKESARSTLKSYRMQWLGGSKYFAYGHIIAEMTLLVEGN